MTDARRMLLQSGMHFTNLICYKQEAPPGLKMHDPIFAYQVSNTCGSSPDRNRMRILIIVRSPSIVIAKYRLDPFSFGFICISLNQPGIEHTHQMHLNEYK